MGDSVTEAWQRLGLERDRYAASADQDFPSVSASAASLRNAVISLTRAINAPGVVVLGVVNRDQVDELRSMLNTLYNEALSPDSWVHPSLAADFEHGVEAMDSLGALLQEQALNGVDCGRSSSIAENEEEDEDGDGYGNNRRQSMRPQPWSPAKQYRGVAGRPGMGHLSSRGGRGSGLAEALVAVHQALGPLVMHFCGSLQQRLNQQQAETTATQQRLAELQKQLEAEKAAERRAEQAEGSLSQAWAERLALREQVAMQEAQIASLMQALALADATVAESITKASPRSPGSPGSQRGTDPLDATAASPTSAGTQQGLNSPSPADALPRQLLPELMSSGADTPAPPVAWSAACQSHPLPVEAVAHDTPASAVGEVTAAAVDAATAVAGVDAGAELLSFPVAAAPGPGAPAPGHVARAIALLQLHSTRTRQLEGGQADACSNNNDLLPGLAPSHSTESSSPVLSSFGSGGFQFTSCPGGYGNDTSLAGQGGVGAGISAPALAEGAASLLAGTGWSPRTISDAGATYRFIAPPAARAFVKTPVPHLALAAACSAGSPDDAQAARDQQPQVHSSRPAATPRLPPRPTTAASAANPFSASAKAPGATAARPSAGGLLPFAGRAALWASTMARAPSVTAPSPSNSDPSSVPAPFSHAMPTTAACDSVPEDAPSSVSNAIVLYTGPGSTPAAEQTTAGPSAPPASNLRKSVCMLLEGYSELDKALVSTLDSSKGVASALWRVAMGVLGLTTNFMLWSPATQASL